MKARGFTLIELLVVVGVVSVLLSMLVPSLQAARELATVVKVHAELSGIAKALMLYAEQNTQALPPTRASCNRDMLGYEFQLPVELAEAGLLPTGPDLRQMVGVEDPFNRGHTYKYRAPGDMVINNRLQANQSFLWVPDGFPQEPDRPGADPYATADGRLYYDPADCPVRWVVWSMGPAGADGRKKAVSTRAPISKQTWYGQPGDEGVICLIMAADGETIASP